VRYAKVKAGSVVKPIMRGYRMACCDCGLVHKINFYIQDGELYFRAWRLVGETKKLRRRKGIRIKHK